MKRIYLIDCPGVVPPNGNDSEEDILLRGVVRVENVDNPHVYIPAVLKRVKPQHIERTYDVRGFEDATAFLELLARKSGRLLKGGEADVDGVAKMVLNDFLRGKIPWFTPPPLLEGQEEKKEKGIEGRKGALGEMGVVRKPEQTAFSAAADGETVSLETATAPSDTMREDLLDPVIAEPTTAEIIPEHNPGEDDDAFESFGAEGDDAGSSAAESDDGSEEEDDSEGGTSLLDPDAFLEAGENDDGDDEADEDDDNDDNNDKFNNLGVVEPQVLQQEETVEDVIAKGLKRKRKG